MRWRRVFSERHRPNVLGTNGKLFDGTGMLACILGDTVDPTTELRFHSGRLAQFTNSKVSPKSASPHVLRHTCAMIILQAT